MIDLRNYGFDPAWIPQGAIGIPARVTAVHKERYELICVQGQAFGRLKTAAYYAGGEEFPTTGDFVLVDHVGEGDCRIRKTLQRKSYFSRLDPSSAGHGEQVVASNFDDVFIMQSLNGDFNLRRLERYLTLGWQSGAVPAVLLTKADLVEDADARIREIQKIAVGVSIYAISVKSGYGLDALSAYVKPRRTIVFLGSSGVGKSSLVNALAGEEMMAVHEIRQDDSRGRHTTTHRQLILLQSGAMVIDTPGMREMGMWDVTDGLGQSFTDVEQYLGRCKFRDCKHQSEPGCAIKAAMESGMLSRTRWESYLHLKNEAKYAEDKMGYLHEKQQWHKTIAKSQKSRVK